MEEEPERLLIGRVRDMTKHKSGTVDAAGKKTQTPRKVPLGRYAEQPVNVQEIRKKPMLRNSLKVPGEDEHDEDDDIFAGSVECVIDRVEAENVVGQRR